MSVEKGYGDFLICGAPCVVLWLLVYKKDLGILGEATEGEGAVVAGGFADAEAEFIVDHEVVNGHIGMGDGDAEVADGVAGAHVGVREVEFIIVEVGVVGVDGFAQVDVGVLCGEMEAAVGGPFVAAGCIDGANQDQEGYTDEKDDTGFVAHAVSLGCS